MDFNGRGSAYAVLQLTIEDILNAIKPLDEDRVTRLNIINNFRNVVQSIQSLRGASVEPFGSFVSDLYTKWGDLDISVELPKTPDSSIAKKQKQKVLRDIMKVLRRGGISGGAFIVNFIPHARVPLLVFECNNPKISCDISVDNLVGQVKSKYLLWISRIDQRFRDMILLVKEWAKTKKINDPKSGTLNSFSLCLLVIFYFQTCQPAIFPPLRDIFEGNIADYLLGTGPIGERQIESTCTVNISRFIRGRLINQSSLSELLVSFFEKFSGIETWSADYAVSTYTGRWEPLTNLANWESKTYKLLIEDPFEQIENAARAVGATGLTKIAEAFQESYQKLSSPTRLSEKRSLVANLVRPHIQAAVNERSSQNSNGFQNNIDQAGRMAGQPSLDNYRQYNIVRPYAPGTGVWRPRYRDNSL